MSGAPAKKLQVGLMLDSSDKAHHRVNELTHMLDSSDKVHHRVNELTHMLDSSDKAHTTVSMNSVSIMSIMSITWRS